MDVTTFNLHLTKEQPIQKIKRFFVGGTFIFIISLGMLGFGVYVIVKVADCYGKCKIHAWIPSYLLLATVAEMVHMPCYFVWIFDDLKSHAFNVYRFVSWSVLLSVSIFGSLIVFPYVTTLDDTWHKWRVDQCPCFYWSFWWLIGTWFSLFFHFSFHFLMYLITPCMNRLIEERERRRYEKRPVNDEELEEAEYALL